MRAPVISKPLKRSVTTNANCSHDDSCVTDSFDNRGLCEGQRPQDVRGLLTRPAVCLSRALLNGPDRQRKLERSAFNVTDFAQNERVVRAPTIASLLTRSDGLSGFIIPPAGRNA